MATDEQSRNAETDEQRDSAQAENNGDVEGVDMPKPTIWPIVVALGLMLLAAGFLTSIVYSLLGAFLFILGMSGWIGQLAPGAGRHIEPYAPKDLRAQPVQPTTVKVARLQPGQPGYRARVPEKVHPYRAGLWGGLVGGVVMAVTAIIYGLVTDRGIWYPVNLLAAMVMPQFNNATVEQLESFSLLALVLGVFIHAAASISMGLVLAIIMPMFPRGQFIWGSLIAPMLWSGFVYGFMGVLNPVMDQHVQWFWFIGSQFAYGIAAVFVILRSEKVEVGGPPSRKAARRPTA